MQYVTMVIFTCSAKHSAISTGQVREDQYKEWQDEGGGGSSNLFSLPVFSLTPVFGCPTCHPLCSCHRPLPKARHSLRVS